MPRIILLGDFQEHTPAHRNLGDALQHFQIVHWLGHHYKDWSVETVFYFAPPEALKEIIRDDDVIALQSSGGMGDTYMTMETVKRRVVQDFPSHRIIMFPQTVFYRDEQIRQTSADIYSRHANLTIMARDYRSYEILKWMLPDGDTLVMPDFVFSMAVDHDYLAALQRAPDAKPLLILRKDKERNGPAHKAVQWCVKDAQRMDLVYPKTRRCREMEAPDFWGPALADMAKARYLVTDRMHGMIFAAVMHIPCVCVPGGGGFPKNGTCYESWLWRAPWIEFLEKPTTETLPAAIERVQQAARTSAIFERHRAVENSMQTACYQTREALRDAVSRVRTFDWWFNHYLPERLGKNLRRLHRPNLFQSRRSHRKFSPFKVNLTEACAVLVDAMASPSACCRRTAQMWLYEPDEAFYAALASEKFAHGAGQVHILANVPRVVVVTYDTRKMVSQSLAERDVGAMCMSFLLAAERRGLQSCWVTVKENLSYVQHVRKQFPAMTEHHKVVAMLPLGYSEDAPSGEDTHHGNKVLE